MDFKNKPLVGIVGGGIASLAASVYLTQKQIPFIIFEKNNHLGGRAYSWKDQSSQDEIDNGQHALFGCYKETLNLLQMVGQKKWNRRNERLRIVYMKKGSRDFVLDFPNMMAPFQIIIALWKTGFIKFKDFWIFLKIGKDFIFSKKACLQYSNVESWLDSYGCSELIKEYLWEPLILSASNIPINQASLYSSLNVIKELFLRHQSNSDILFSDEGLTYELIEPMAHYHQKNLGKILLGEAVRSIEKNQDGFVLVTSKQEYQFDRVIVTIPPDQIQKIQFRNINFKPLFTQNLSIPYTSIMTLYLWTSKSITHEKLLGFVGTQMIQYLFTRNSKNPKQYVYSIVVSWADQWMSWKPKEIADLAIQELKDHFSLSNEDILKIKVVKVAKAVLSSHYQYDHFNQVNWCQDGVIFAGDWTYRDFPGTIESAVRSAKRAVKSILND